MQNKTEHFDKEIEDLKEELRHFQLEKDRVRAIVGKIGGVPRFNTTLYNIIFATIIVVSLAISLVSSNTLRLFMIELATATISAKIIYMMHCQSKVNHFQLWIMSSLEWRINEMMKLLRLLKNPA